MPLKKERVSVRLDPVDVDRADSLIDDVPIEMQERQGEPARADVLRAALAYGLKSILARGWDPDAVVPRAKVLRARGGGR